MNIDIVNVSKNYYEVVSYVKENKIFYEITNTFEILYRRFPTLGYFDLHTIFTIIGKSRSCIYEIRYKRKIIYFFKNNMSKFTDISNQFLSFYENTKRTLSNSYIKLKDPKFLVNKIINKKTKELK